ncbi:MAG: hypothetical protein JRC86_06425, partial [Deltaproteobacteria bacterium]|nr:hypothetical protein [Deltaproteobacteria bacterium]
MAYINDNAIKGNTVTIMPSADIADLDIYGNTIIARHDNPGPIPNSTFSSAKSSLTDPDIIYSVSGSTLDVNADLLIWNGKTLTPGADIFVSGNFINNGTFGSGNNTVTLDGTLAGKTITSGGSTFNNLIINGGGAWTIQDTLTVTGNLILANGAVTQNADVAISGDYLQSGGTFTCTDPENISFSAGGSFSLPGGTFDRYTGMGNNGQPYIIRDVYDLQAMKCSLNSHYDLAGNIDASATSHWNSDGAGGYYGFEPVGTYSKRFTGTLDGQEYTITDLYINRPLADHVGLFGYASSKSTMENIRLEGGSVSGDDYVGGLVGWAHDSTITNTYATGEVTGDGNNIGGLIGFHQYSTITDCHATGGVTGGTYVGGLVGYAGYQSAITGCYATGEVTGTGNFVGGLAGYKFNKCPATDCYASGAVSGANYVGGLVGQVYGPSLNNSYATGDVTGTGDYVGGLAGRFDFFNPLTITNCYATGDVSGDDNVGGLVGYCFNTTMTDCYATGTVTGTGNYTGGLLGVYHYGDITNSYATGEVNGAYYTGGLIGHGGYDSTITNTYATGAVTGIDNVGGLVGFKYNECLVTDSRAEGTVDGRNYVGGLAGYCYGTSITDSSATGAVTGTGNYTGGLVGLYGYHPSTVPLITGSHAEGTVTGNDYAGGLVGHSANCFITNSYAVGAVSGDDYVGGLTGSYFNATMSDSYATGTVNGTGYYAGGLTGYVGQTATITHTYATGAVTGNESVGGLVGYLYHSSTISISAAIGEVTGTNKVGGLVGHSYGGTIIDSLAMGNVTGTNYIGGLIGYYNYAAPSVNNTYAAGLVTGTNYVGGLIGYEESGDPSGCGANFWDIWTSGLSGADDGVGNQSGPAWQAVVTEKNTADMITLSTFLMAGWDYVSIWAMIDGRTYPFLLWQYPGETYVLSGTVYEDRGVTDIGPGASIALAVNGTFTIATNTVADGTYYFLLGSHQMSLGDAALVFIDDNAIDGNTATVVYDKAITDLDIYGDTVIVRHDIAGLITNADLSAAKGPLTDADIIYSVSGSTLDVDNLMVWSGKNYAPGGDIQISGDFINNGTFTPGNNALIIGGSGTSTISGSTTFYDLTSVTPGKTLVFDTGGTQTIQNTLTLTGAPGNLINIQSSVPGTPAEIVANISNVNYVAVQDSNNSGAMIYPANSTNL